MGPETAELPPLPNVEWNMVPEANVHISIRVQECNWLQALEGEIDFRACAILHSRIDSKGQVNAWLAKRDLRPTFECVRQDFGMSIAAKRQLGDQKLYWRVNQFVMPFYSLVPPQSKFPDLSGHAWVPIDDNQHALHFLLLSSVRTAARTHQGIVRGRPPRPRDRPPEPACLCETPGHRSVLRLLDPLYAARTAFEIRP
jgi:hypothetical protein